MLTPSSTGHQTNFFGADLLLQLDPRDPLLRLAQAFPWSELDSAFTKHYTQGHGRPSKPIRLMVGLLILKQLDNLSDEQVVLNCKRNPYYQAFCGFTEFSNKLPCDSTELVHFRKRIGTEGVDRIFQISVKLHGKAALEATVNIDTTVQEKYITYPTDAKLAIKVINRLNKLAKHEGIQQRRSYGKEVKALRLNLRHFRHIKRRAKAKKALKRLRTIAHALIRELRRGLPKHRLFDHYQKDFLFYERVLGQQRHDKDKIYSLHEPTAYCIGKGKDHKPYEYGNKVSIAATAKSNIIVGVASHEHNLHDSKTLPDILAHTESSRGKPVKAAVCDRGYQGPKTVGSTQIILPGPPLTGQPLPTRQKTQTLPEKSRHRTHHRPLESRLPLVAELPQRHHRRPHQPVDGGIGLEPGPVDAGFLGFYSWAAPQHNKPAIAIGMFLQTHTSCWEFFRGDYLARLLFVFGLSLVANWLGCWAPPAPFEP